MKIFVSYSRRDSGDFAKQIQKHLSSFNYDIFTDVDSIRAGEIWSNTIETNISSCDFFVVIVTYGALKSPHVAKEVLQAQREKKIIIPCFHKNVRVDDIKWGLNKIQGIEFSDKYELERELYSKIGIETTNKLPEFSNKTQSIEEVSNSAQWNLDKTKILKHQKYSDINIERPYTTSHFDAEIISKKQAYERGKDTVQFRSIFKGRLTNGFFANLICAPEDDEFENTTDNVSEDRKYVKLWCRETLDYWSDKDKGKLTGDVNIDWKYWNWNIPEFAPLGDYKVEMGVYDSVTNNKKPILTLTDTIRVIDKDDSHYRRHNRVSI